MVEWSFQVNVTNFGFCFPIKPLNKDIKLLEESIEHWERMRRAPIACYKRGENTTDRSCPLCREYFDDKCYGCPIRDDVDASKCRATPYGSAAASFDNLIDTYLDEDSKDLKNIGFKYRVKLWRNNAQAEIDYLKELKKNLEKQAK